MAERDYKAEYKKFQSSKKMKKYRAELNKYNRKKGTYGNGDGKDASHKGGKIVGFESESTNRGRREKSRLKKEHLLENTMDTYYIKNLNKMVIDQLNRFINRNLDYKNLQVGDDVIQVNLDKDNLRTLIDLIKKIDKQNKNIYITKGLTNVVYDSKINIKESAMAQSKNFKKILGEILREGTSYEEFFRSALEKFGVNSPDELDADKKDEFFNYVDANWDAGENETDPDENINEFMGEFPEFSKRKGAESQRIQRKKMNTVEESLRKIIKKVVAEELSFINFSDLEGQAAGGRKVQKRKKRMSVSV